MGMIIGLQMDRAELQPEYAAGQPSDDTAQHGAAGYVYGIVNAHVYLRISN